MFIVLDNLVEAADAEIKLTNTLLLQRLKEQAGIAHGEEILLFLLGIQIGNQFSLLFLAGKFAHLKDMLVYIFAAMCPNNEHPVAPTSLEAMHMILVTQDSRVRL